MLSDGNSQQDAETKTLNEWRKEGSEHFAKGDIQEAERCYRNGLEVSYSFRRDVSVVLNNVAAVHLTMHQETRSVPGITVDAAGFSEPPDVESVEAALLNATVAGIVDPLNYKAWSRRSRCLHQAGYTPEECAIDLRNIIDSVAESSLLQTSARMGAFMQNLQVELQRFSEMVASNVEYQVNDVPTEVQREERDAMNPEKLPRGGSEAGEHTPFDSLDRDDVDIDAYIARMEGVENMTRFAYASMKRQHKDLPREMEMYVKNPPPQVHLEFPKLRGWPDGIDPIFARKVLYRAYLDAGSNPWVNATVLRKGKVFDITTQGDMIKRWHGTGAFDILNAKADSLRYGDIIDGRDAMGGVVPLYGARIRSNFANNPSRAEVYFFGTTHIAIGFNDFSSLVAATLHEKASGPLRFVGFEMSEFAVAKCKVVAQMLKSSHVLIASVMEVWLSSTWSQATLSEFRSCVRSVLQSLTEAQENPKVLSYLRYWASVEPISAAKARREFFLNLERYNNKVLGGVFSFRREVDRLDLTQYFLTGEVRPSPNAVEEVKEQSSQETAEQTDDITRKMKRKMKKRARQKAKKQEARENAPRFGSLTMWLVPPGAPPLEEDVAFNVMEFRTLLDEYAKRERQGAAETLSVVDLFVFHIMQNLNRLRGLILTDRLTIDVHYGVVKAVRGETMNDQENEALLARIAMMRPYTISWSNVLDYFMPEDFHDLARRCSEFGDCMHYGYSMNWTTQVFGASILDLGLFDHKAFVEHILDTALGFGGASLPNPLKLMGLDKLLFLPFHENLLNITAYPLAVGFHKHWVAHFLNKGQLTPEAFNRLGSK